MRVQDSDLVRRLPLFSAMAQASFDSLSAAGYLQRFPAGVVLVHEGERPDFLHVLVEGAVEFFSTHGERETTLSVLTPPSAFILAAVIVDGVYLKSARTLTASTVVLIPAEAVREVFLKDPAFARATVVELACRYRAVVKDLKNQRLRTGLQRLASWIVVQDESCGGSGRFRIPIEKRVLASQLGLRPENLSRAFADLQKVGIVVDGPVITIKNRDALIAVAEPNPLIDAPETCLDEAVHQTWHKTVPTA
jgi:CRP/FNR family transcriptional activator FtrB